MRKIIPPLWAVISVLGTSLLGAQMASAQAIKSISPAPNSVNTTLPQQLEMTLTEQSEIKLDTVKVWLNQQEVKGNLAINTADRSLRFVGTPPTYNVGTNTVQVTYETQSGIKSQHQWPFAIDAAASTGQSSTSTGQSSTSTGQQAAVPLKPELTRQFINGNLLVLEGKTQPGASVAAAVNAMRPASAVNLGPISINTGQAQTRQLSANSMADNEGKFRMEFNVTGDPAGTQYNMTVTATNANQTDQTTALVTR